MKKSAMARLQTRNLTVIIRERGPKNKRESFSFWQTYIWVRFITTSADLFVQKSPWHIDPIPAAGEDENNAAVAEESEEENNPDSASEGPPDPRG